MASESGAGRIGFVGLLTLLFIALKLTHVIHWKWLWVLSPLWIVASVVLAIFVIVFVIGLLTNR